MFIEFCAYGCPFHLTGTSKDFEPRLPFIIESLTKTKIRSDSPPFQIAQAFSSLKERNLSFIGSTNPKTVQAILTSSELV